MTASMWADLESERDTALAEAASLRQRLAAAEASEREAREALAAMTAERNAERAGGVLAWFEGEAAGVAFRQELRTERGRTWEAWHCWAEADGWFWLARHWQIAAEQEKDAAREERDTARTDLAEERARVARLLTSAAEASARCSGVPGRAVVG